MSSRAFEDSHDTEGTKAMPKRFDATTMLVYEQHGHSKLNGKRNGICFTWTKVEDSTAQRSWINAKPVRRSVNPIPNSAWCARPGQFFDDLWWDNNGIKKVRKHALMADDDQVMKWAGIGDYSGHPSDSRVALSTFRSGIS